MELGLKKSTELYRNEKRSVIVYLAVNLNTKKVAVVKELSTKNYHKAHRFYEEAWAHMSLHHSHITRCYSACHSYLPEDGRYRCMLVMERLAVDLETLIKHKRTNFREDILWKWLRQAVDALAYAQKRGISHRDIKPKNLLLTDEGDLKIADFGFSKFISDSNERHTCLGTAPYLSPILLLHLKTVMLQGGKYEKAYHNPFKSDVYSLGMSILHAALLNLPRDTVNRQKHVDECEYSAELLKVLREMLQEDEKHRMDFLALQAYLNNSFFVREAQSPPSLLSIRTEDFGESMDSASPPSTLAQKSDPVYCVQCKRDAENGLPLPCNPAHSVCSVDCLAVVVAEKGFSSADCAMCMRKIGEQWLLDAFRGRAAQSCSDCGRPVKKQYRVMQCHHLLCKRHFIFNSSDCPKCHVPCSIQKLRNLQTYTRQFVWFVRRYL